MPLITASIGLATDPIEHAVDARWTMAYSAALGDTEDVYLDTTRPGGVVAHPLFAICPEWPVALASREMLHQRGLTTDEFRRGVHATHDTHVYRLVRPGDKLSTVATVLDINVWRAGAYITTCFDTRDEAGTLICRSFNGTLMRGVELMSVNKAPIPNLETGIDIPRTPHEEGQTASRVDQKFSLPIAANLAHVYSECARIWNPIHTDAAVAKAAGLPGIIVHGSAPLALAVSAIVRAYAGGDPARVVRICGQFRAMVLMPSTLTLQCFEPVDVGGDTVVPFDLRNERNEAALSKASVVLRQHAS